MPARSDSSSIWLIIASNGLDTYLAKRSGRRQNSCSLFFLCGLSQTYAHIPTSSESRYRLPDLGWSLTHIQAARGPCATIFLLTTTISPSIRSVCTAIYDFALRHRADKTQTPWGSPFVRRMPTVREPVAQPRVSKLTCLTCAV